VEAHDIYTTEEKPDAQPPDAESLDDLLDRLKVWHPTKEELDAEAAEAQLAASTALPGGLMIDTGDPDERPGTRLSGATGSSGDVEETLAAVLEEAERQGGRRSSAAGNFGTPTDSTGGMSSSSYKPQGRLDATASERDPDEAASDVPVDEAYEPPAFVERLFHASALEQIDSLARLSDPATLAGSLFASVSQEEGMISEFGTEDNLSFGRQTF